MEIFQHSSSTSVERQTMDNKTDAQTYRQKNRQTEEQTEKQADRKIKKKNNIMTKLGNF